LNSIQKIVLIGAGSVATHLGVAFLKTGRKIQQVYSRTEESAKHLSERLNAESTSDMNKIYREADLYLISVADGAVEEIAGKLQLDKKLIVHTSGSLPMDILSKSTKNYGVLYPLQTFSKTREADLSIVPICIEANSADNLQKIEQLAKELSAKVVVVDSEKRKIIHLAAVFACNFSNFMYDISDKILEDNNLDFELLRPLILETAIKVQEFKPGKVQTGPAIRGDEEILKKHVRLLKEYPEYQKIYDMLSEGIREMEK
jgi:predicted short-subunit dehydrogenase-like oxidoreductase (DUF2520 family)